MRFLGLMLLFLAGMVRAQDGAATAVSTEQAPTAPENAAATHVGPDDPVITIADFCAGPTQAGRPCTTVVTRAQFERLTEALQPGMPLSLRLTVANAYARNLRMSASAEKRDLDKTPAFEEEMRYARMQLLAQDLDRALRTEANHISDADLEDYYKKNQPSYEQATVARIFVPHTRQLAPPAQPTEGQKKDSEDAMTKIAADLRARAVRGEDPDKLQLDAYAEAAEPRSNADTKLDKVRRSTLPPQHEKVMDLKLGEVSEVFSDPGGAHFIYKMISKQTLPLEDVKPEIRTAISTERYRNSMKPFEGDVVFSDTYFVPPGKPNTAPQSNRRGKRKDSPAQSDENHN